jgi:hypothetical protein
VAKAVVFIKSLLCIAILILGIVNVLFHKCLPIGVGFSGRKISVKDDHPIF